MTQESLPSTAMKSSRQKRLESKKRKAAAFLQIAELNDEDRLQTISRPPKKSKTRQESSSDSDLPSIDLSALESKKPISECQEILKSNEAKEQLQSSHKKPLLEGEEYEALKRRLKERKKALQALPQFTLKSVGHEAEIGMHESYRTPLFMKDLQHLLLYALMGSKAPVEPSRCVENI